MTNRTRNPHQGLASGLWHEGYTAAHSDALSATFAIIRRIAASDGLGGHEDVLLAALKTLAGPGPIKETDDIPSVVPGPPDAWTTDGCPPGRWRPIPPQSQPERCEPAECGACRGTGSRSPGKGCDACADTGLAMTREDEDAAALEAALTARDDGDATAWVNLDPTGHYVSLDDIPDPFAVYRDAFAKGEESGLRMRKQEIAERESHGQRFNRGDRVRLKAMPQVNSVVMGVSPNPALQLEVAVIGWRWADELELVPSDMDSFSRRQA